MTKILPKVVYIETTNLCNASCVMCPHKYMKRRQGFMSDSIFKKVIEEGKDMALQGAQIFFHKEGEPLLDESLPDKISYAIKELGQHNEYGINTNAMLLTKEKSEALISSGLSTIYFSLDGVEKKKYENIRVNLNYDTVVDNIKQFFKVKKDNNSNIRVIMQMLVKEDDAPEIALFKEQWGDFPCEFYIKRMHSYLDGGCSTITSYLDIKQQKICDDPFKILVIFIDGNVGLCCWDYNNEYNLGNIKYETLENLFNNSKAQYIRDKMLRMDCSDIKPCNRCSRIFGKDYISGN